ncbi:MAG: hypothetical protein Q9159_001039 [Coniocarpon cinnabarinum]
MTASPKNFDQDPIHLPNEVLFLFIRERLDSITATLFPPLSSLPKSSIFPYSQWHEKQWRDLLCDILNIATTSPAVRLEVKRLMTRYVRKMKARKYEAVRITVEESILLQKYFNDGPTEETLTLAQAKWIADIYKWWRNALYELEWMDDGE